MTVTIMERDTITRTVGRDTAMQTVWTVTRKTMGVQDRVAADAVSVVW